MPKPAAALWTLGTAQFYGGERGWPTWNMLNAAGPLYYEQLTYTVEDGWQLDLHQPSPAKCMAQSVAGTGTQQSWAIEWIAGSETVEASELIEIRGGERTQHLVTLYHGEYTVLAFANETTGIVSVSVKGHAGYLGWFWLPYEMPGATVSVIRDGERHQPGVGDLGRSRHVAKQQQAAVHAGFRPMGGSRTAGRLPRHAPEPDLRQRRPHVGHSPQLPGTRKPLLGAAKRPMDLPDARTQRLPPSTG